MNKAFEKILERLRNAVDKECVSSVLKVRLCDAMEIVQEVAEEYKGGWVPIDKKLPPDDNFILLSFSNFSVPIVGRYEEDEDGGGNFFAGDEDEPLISQDLFVNAWMPLPKPYEEIQYTANNK